MTYRASAHGSGLSEVPITIPSTVEAGDGIIVFYHTSKTSDLVISTPAGWTRYASLDNLQNGRSIVYGKIAAGGDPGSMVTFANNNSVGRSVALLTVHSGIDADVFVYDTAGAAEDTSGTDHTCPTVNITRRAAAICAVTEKSGNPSTAGTGSWSVGSPFTLRDSYTNPTANGVSEGAVADDATDHAPGESIGGATFTSDQAWDNAIMWTIAVALASTEQTVRPQSVVDMGGWTAVPEPGTGVSAATLLADSDDGTYWESPDGGGTAAASVGTVADPGADASVVVSVKISTDDTATVSRTLSLRQGATVVSSHTDTTVPTSPTWIEWALDATEVAAVDWTTPLDVRVETALS